MPRGKRAGAMAGAAGRLVVGVTGHRRLGDEAALARTVDAALDELESGARVRGGRVCLVVLSPLAEGADRLVARRVLARPGGALEAVLPMSEKRYAEDFEVPGSVAQFRELLALAGKVHRLPRSADRAKAYGAAGRYVVDHCDVLVAVWDGRLGDGPGGTADAVAYARESGRPVRVVDPSSPRSSPTA